MIGQRTRDALAVARRRLAAVGRKLGNPNGARALILANKGNVAAVARIVNDAKVRAENYRETLVDIDHDGTLSLQAIATALNEREIVSPRGARWYPASVARLRERLRQRMIPISHDDANASLCQEVRRHRDF
jgi:hypothetical protein